MLYKFRELIEEIKVTIKIFIFVLFVLFLLMIIVCAIKSFG